MTGSGRSPARGRPDAHDARRDRLVRPAGWENPAPAGRYDLVVIGAGTAGLVAAAVAAGLGGRTALVERARMGGECLNTGCVPSKALLRSARAAADARDAGRFGVRLGGEVAVDFGAVMERMRRLRAELAVHDSAERFREMGVDVFFGEGRFAGPATVAVDDVALRFRRAVIATGARPAEPPIEGLEGGGWLTSETVFSLAALPRRLAVVGGGPVGCELAQAFARFGAAVTLVERADRLLTAYDPDASTVVRDALAADGVEVLVGAEVLRAEPAGGARRLVVAGGDGARRIEVDEVLVAAGRVADTARLDPAAAGIRLDASGGVEVDDRLRTSNRRVYAIGDAIAGPGFTHLSDAQARVAVRNALFPGRRRASALVVPWCTYTDPEVAHVGHSARSAAEAGIAIRSFTQPLATVDRAVLEGETGGFVRIHARRGSGEIVGGTVVARHAGEIVGEIVLAIGAGAGLDALGETIHPYPTRAEALRRIGDAHLRTKLTPTAWRLLRAWWAVFRRL